MLMQSTVFCYTTHSCTLTLCWMCRTPVESIFVPVPHLTHLGVDEMFPLGQALLYAELRTLGLSHTHILQHRSSLFFKVINVKITVSGSRYKPVIAQNPQTAFQPQASARGLGRKVYAWTAGVFGLSSITLLFLPLPEPNPPQPDGSVRLCS